MNFKQRALVILITFTMLVTAGGEAISSPPSPAPGLETEVTAAGVTLSWTLPPAEITTDRDGRLQASIPGLALDNRPGYPQVPVASALLALPLGAKPQLSLLDSNEKFLPAAGQFALAPEPEGVVRDAAGAVLRGAYRPVQNQAAGLALQPVQIEDLGLLRGVRLARVSLRPVIQDQAGLRTLSAARVQVQFNFPAGHAPVTAEPALPQDSILQLVEHEVVNPQQLPAAYQAPGSISASWPDPLPVRGKAAIEIETSGLVKLTMEQLQAAGYPVSQVNIQKLHLMRGAVEIPFEFVGNPNDGLSAGEWLRFYAEPRFSRWTRAETYYLFENETDRLALPTRSAAPGSPAKPESFLWLEQKFETNKIYTPYYTYGHIPTGADGDRWMGDFLTFPGEISRTYTYTLPGLNPAGTASLSLGMIGYTDLIENPDHRVAVSVNGSQAGVLEWDGKTAQTGTWTLPAGRLKAGANVFHFALPGGLGPVEGSWLDSFQVRYAVGPAIDFSARLTGQDSPSSYRLNTAQTPDLFDVTTPDQPVRLNATWSSGVLRFEDPDSGSRRYFFQPAGAGYIAPARVRMVQPLESPASDQVEYLIITHPDFRVEAERLAARRQGQGLMTAIEEVDPIYDAYSQGEPTPEAIRAFIQNGYNTSGWRLTYVVLFGDGTVDPKHYQSDSSNTFIPPYLADVDPWAGETAADNRFVTVQGTDALPDVYLGRLPVNTPAEAKTVVDKIIRYEDAAGAPWMNNWLFVADDPETSQSDNSVLDFPGFQDQLIEKVNKSGVVPSRLYYPSGEKTEAFTELFRQSLVDTWNQGKGFIVYNGHSSIHQWAVEKFFHHDNIPQLNGADRLSILLEMTCFTGAFHWAWVPTLDESLLRHPQGGAAAVWGSTGLGITEGQAVMAEGFMDQLLSEPVTRLGPATLQGKLDLLLERPVYADLVETFTLLGDPATQVTQVQQPLQFIPTIFK